MDYLLNNPVSPLPALRQAAGRNPEPLILSGAQLTPSSSLAPGLTSRPSSSNSEQDELMIMDWYEGSIGEAIQFAKMSNSVFVVVIYGKS